MKPFQFYKVKRFPHLKTGESVSTVVQMTFFGEGEDVRTTITLLNPDFQGPLDLLRVESEIKHETLGYIKTVIDSQRRKLDFNEYLEPVDFQAFHATKKKLMIFQAAKKECRGVLANLRAKACDVDLLEMVVDFTKVLDLCREYQGAWFRQVSSRVRAAGIHGEQIQNDPLFKKLLKDGQLSNVTIPWRLDKLDPAIMIGSRFGLWPEDQETVNVRALAEFFTQLTHLPRLQSPQVIAEAIAKGVQRGIFAYALGDAEAKKYDTIRFNDQTVTADRCEITESAWLLRPALAKALMPKPDLIAPGAPTLTPSGDGGPGSTDTTTTGGGPAVKIVKGERRLNRVRIIMHVPWANWLEVYNEVIDPLAKEGAEIICDVNILAESEGGIRENTVELVIRESLSQRGIKAEIQKG